MWQIKKCIQSMPKDKNVVCIEKIFMILQALHVLKSLTEKLILLLF